MFLQSNNIKILCKNFRSKIGEIDIIGQGKAKDITNPGRQIDVIIFFEVKYRKTDRAGFAESAVDWKKQKTICRVSDYYRVVNNLSEDTPVRYDVIAVNDNTISWYENAFGYVR